MRPMRLMLVVAFACLLTVAGEANGQTRPPVSRDTNITHVLYLVDGSTLVGKLIDRDSVSVFDNGPETFGIMYAVGTRGGPAGCVVRDRNELLGVLSYGVRFMGEKLSTDFALWNASEEFIFPGIPYIAFAVKF